MRAITILPQRQFVKDGKQYVLRTARTYHRCDGCGHLIDPGTNYYSASWLHTGLGRVEDPQSYHQDCVEAGGG